MNKVTHLVGRALRETGQAMDRLGLTISGTESFRDTFSRHRSNISLCEKSPVIAKGVFVAPSATLIGNVTLSSSSSVWYNSVIRADNGRVFIGEKTNVQDTSVINTIVDKDVYVGKSVTIGHGAILTSCNIGDYALIGQGAFIEQGVKVGSKSMIAAGAVVIADTEVPSGQLWGGNPAKFLRNITAEEISFLEKSANGYASNSAEHAATF